MALNHQGTIMIETKHLILRPFALTDGKEMYENWASDPDVTQFLRWEPHESHTFTNELLKIWCNEYSNPDFYQWAIYHKKHNTLIGSISAFKRDDNEPSKTEIGYCLGKAFWGHGYCTESLRAICHYLIDDVGFNELYCCHAIQNPASGTVMRKVGFIYTHNDTYEKFNGEKVECSCYKLTPKTFIVESF